MTDIRPATEQDVAKTLLTGLRSQLAWPFLVLFSRSILMR